MYPAHTAGVYKRWNVRRALCCVLLSRIEQVVLLCVYVCVRERHVFY
jgi:hypothetical protein